MSISEDVQELSPGNIIDMFELDTTGAGGAVVFRWCNYVNELGNDVIYDGESYARLPVEASGFERTGDSKQPRPRLRVANVTGLIGALAKEVNDLVGAKLTRKRTFVKYLDAVNFASGNPLADPNARFGDEIWFIDRKSSENGFIIEFELSSSLDLTGVKLPRRQVVQNVCPWLYRGAECGYTGPAVAKIDDTPTSNLAVDECGKRILSCQLRFGANGVLNFGAMPGAGR